MLKRFMVLAVLFGCMAVVTPGQATCTSGPAFPYSGGTWAPEALGYSLGTSGAAGTTWVGYKFSDGYGVLDVTGTNVRFRTYSGWGANKHNSYLYTASASVGTSPSGCGQVWPLWTWPVGGNGGDLGTDGKIPLFPGADGCVLVAVNGKPCSFNGGGTGGYAIAAPTWNIYKAGGSGSVIVLSSSSTPVGTMAALPAIPAPYYFLCLGAVTTTRPPASACSASSTGIAIVTHT